MKAKKCIVGASRPVMNLEDELRIYPSGEFSGIDLTDSMAESLSEAFASRRDYEAKKRDIKIKKIDLKIKENQKWPEIDLVASMAMAMNMDRITFVYRLLPP